jgi:hypothetical protein
VEQEILRGLQQQISYLKYFQIIEPRSLAQAWLKELKIKSLVIGGIP